MNVELLIAATPEPVNKNVFELEVDYMHGDADATTTKTFFYFKDKDEHRLKRDLIGLKAYPWDRDEDVIELVAEALAAAGVDNADDLASSFDDRFYESDSTCEGERAPVEGISLYFYDEVGQKFPVNVNIAGEKFLA